MIWANFLHIYQPPNQKSYWVNRITDESYRKIFRLLLGNPKAKVTMNISSVLLELFDENNHRDVIDMARKLVKRGQMEVTGSAKYHPLLPFLPKEEVIRQVKLNEKTLRYFLGKNTELRGFFPPEMGFSPDLAKIIAALGYSWVIVDELSFPRDGKKHHSDRIYQIKGLKNFSIFFRERRTSWIILSGQIGTGKLLVQSLGDRLNKNEYLLTAMDGETFGHHRPGLENLLFEIYNSNLRTVKISELIDLFPRREAIKPISATWALMEKDLERKKPFARWHDRENPIHQAQWELTKLAIDTINKKNKKNTACYKKVRVKLDRSLHSDQYWWASAKPWWSIEMIESGAKELYGSIILCPGATKKVKKRAEKLYHQIVFTAFEWQRLGIVDQMSRAEDEEIRQRTDIGLPKLPRAEIEKMVKHLKKEMASVVSLQEYERAAQIRDRIKELKRYASDIIRPSAEGDQEFELSN